MEEEEDAQGGRNEHFMGERDPCGMQVQKGPVSVNTMKNPLRQWYLPFILEEKICIPFSPHKQPLRHREMGSWDKVG